MEQRSGFDLFFFYFQTLHERIIILDVETRFNRSILLFVARSFFGNFSLSRGEEQLSNYLRWNDQSQFFSQVKIILQQRIYSFFQKLIRLFLEHLFSMLKCVCSFSYLLLIMYRLFDNRFSVSPEISSPNATASFFVPSFLPSIFSLPKASTFVWFFQEILFTNFFVSPGETCSSVLSPKIGRVKARQNARHLRWHVRRLARHVTSLHESHVRATEARRATPTRAASADFRITGWQLAGCCEREHRVRATSAAHQPALRRPRNLAPNVGPVEDPLRSGRRELWRSSPSCLAREMISQERRKKEPEEGKYIEERGERIYYFRSTGLRLAWIASSMLLASCRTDYNVACIIIDT